MRWLDAVLPEKRPSMPWKYHHGMPVNNGKMTIVFFVAMGVISLAWQASWLLWYR